MSNRTPKNGRRILRLFRPYRKRLLGLFALIILAAGLGIIPAFLLQDLLNNVLSQGKNLNVTELNLLIAGMVAIPIITGAIGVAQTWQSNLVGQQVMHDLRTAVYSHLQRLSLAFFTRTRTGEVQSRISNDIGGVQSVVTTTATSIVSNLTTVIATSVAMILLDWQLAAAAFALLPVFVLITRRIGRLQAGAGGHHPELAGRHLVAGRRVALGVGSAAGKDDGAKRRADRAVQHRVRAPGRPGAAPAHGRPLGDGVDPGHLRGHAGDRVRHRRPPARQRQ